MAHLNFNQTSSAMPSQNHVNITLIPELWNKSALRLPMKSFCCISKTTSPTYQGQEYQVHNKGLRLGENGSIIRQGVQFIDSSFPLSKGYMNIHSDLTFSPQSETESNQSRSFPAGGNPDLSELIFPDDILAPPTADLYLNICCRKYTMQD